MKSTLLKCLVPLATMLLIATSGTVAQTLSFDKLAPHPRIIFDAATAKKYDRNVSRDSVLNVLHQSVIVSANDIIPRAAVKRSFNGRRLTTSASTMQRTLALAYAYRTTGDTRYAARAEREMLSAAQMDDWNPEIFADAADLALALGIGYDWCYEALDAETRAKIAAAIVDKALRPSLEENYSAAWINTGGSENQVCNTGLVVGALAVADIDKELAQTVIDRSLVSVKQSLKLYEPDGAYPEGYGGWVTGTSYTAIMFSALESALGKGFKMPKNELKAFIKSGIYSLQMISPRYYSFSYGDRATHAAINYASIWLYDRTSDESMLFNTTKSLSRDKEGDYKKERLLPLCVVEAVKAGAPVSAGKAPIDLVTYLSGGITPVAVLRSHWGSYRDCLYAGLKLGSPSIPHNHQDVGSFAFEARGIRWSMDLGSDNEIPIERQGVDMNDCSQSSRRWDFFRYSLKSHSTLSFNGEPQNVAGRAVIDNFEEVDNRRSVVSNLSELYPQVKSVERALSMVGRSYIVVQDRITTGATAVTVRWNMLSMATNIEPLDRTNALLTRSNEKLFMTVLANTPVNFGAWSATPANSFENQNTGVQSVGFEATLEPDRTYEFTVYLSPDRKMNLSQRKYYTFK